MLLWFETDSNIVNGNGAEVNSRFQSTASWFDGFGRAIATANYGTNGGTALVRPATVPARSDNVLVSETRYDAATGRAFRTIDPAGKDHRTFVDALGRTVRTVANFTGTGTVSAANPDQNVTVEMTYHPSGQIATLTAKNPETQQFEVQPDGSLIVQFEVVPSHELTNWILKLGCHAEVLEPTSLREEVKKEIARMLRRYDSAISQS